MCQRAFRAWVALCALVFLLSASKRQGSSAVAVSAQAAGSAPSLSAGQAGGLSLRLGSGTRFLGQAEPIALEYCKRVLGTLQPQHLRTLSDSLAQMQLHKRRLDRNRINLERLQAPNPFANDNTTKQFKMWEAAYKRVTYTAKEMQTLVHQGETAVNSMDARVNQELGKLKAARLIAEDATYKTLAPCLFRRVYQHNFPDQPEVSFMLQYFKRPWVVDRIVERAQACQAVVPCELVVNVDNIEEHGLWANLSYTTKGFVVPVLSANVHEIRAFNRLAAVARGKVLIVLQDDELLPSDCSWLRDVTTMFRRIPSLGVIGHRGYIYSHGHRNTHGYAFFQEPTTRIPFQYVLAADYAPISFRRSAFMELGGVDEGMSEPGECGIISDHELCVRMWKAGWRVGHMEIPGREGDPEGKPGGTHRTEVQERCWGKQMRLGVSYLWSRHGEWDGPAFASLAVRVAQLNLQELAPRPVAELGPEAAAKLADLPGRCPFHIGCDPNNVTVH